MRRLFSLYRFFMTYSFVCAAEPCGFGIYKVICFFAYAAGGQEASVAGLLPITATKGAFPASGLHPCLRSNLPSDSEAPSNGG